MSFAAQDKYYTFTGMVELTARALYKPLTLKQKIIEIMPEIIYKSMIYCGQGSLKYLRTSTGQTKQIYRSKNFSLKVLRSFFSGLMSGFIFRPYILDSWAFGAILMILSLYELVWLLYDTVSYMAELHKAGCCRQQFSFSLATQFGKNPQTFLVGGITFLIAIQFWAWDFITPEQTLFWGTVSPWNFIKETRTSEQ